MKLCPQTVLSVLVSLVAASGCNSMGKQPADPYTVSRIPAPATYSYSQTILGQQPGQAPYSPPGAASTFPPTTPATNATPLPPATVPVTPSPAPGPMSSEQPASIYGGSLGGGATLYPTAATISPNSWTATQTVPTTPSSETATRSADALAATTPTVSSAAPMSLDTWSTSPTQVVTQVVE